MKKPIYQTSPFDPSLPLSRTFWVKAYRCASNEGAKYRTEDEAGRVPPIADEGAESISDALIGRITDLIAQPYRNDYKPFQSPFKGGRVRFNLGNRLPSYNNKMLDVVFESYGVQADIFHLRDFPTRPLQEKETSDE